MLLIADITVALKGERAKITHTGARVQTQPDSRASDFNNHTVLFCVEHMV